MATPIPSLNLPGTFGPDELARITRAYEEVLQEVTEDNEDCLAIGARELRRRVAVAIIREASAGRTEVDSLRRRGLASLGLGPPPGSAGRSADPAENRPVSDAADKPGR